MTFVTAHTAHRTLQFVLIRTLASCTHHSNCTILYDVITAVCVDPDLGGCYDKMHNEIDAAITYGASGGLVFAFTAYVGVCATAIYWMHLGRARKEKGVMSEQLEEELL